MFPQAASPRYRYDHASGVQNMIAYIRDLKEQIRGVLRSWSIAHDYNSAYRMCWLVMTMMYCALAAPETVMLAAYDEVAATLSDPEIRAVPEVDFPVHEVWRGLSLPVRKRMYQDMKKTAQDAVTQLVSTGATQDPEEVETRRSHTMVTAHSTMRALQAYVEWTEKALPCNADEDWVDVVHSIQETCNFSARHDSTAIDIEDLQRVDADRDLTVRLLRMTQDRGWVPALLRRWSDEGRIPTWFLEAAVSVVHARLLAPTASSVGERVIDFVANP